MIFIFHDYKNTIEFLRKIIRNENEKNQDLSQWFRSSFNEYTVLQGQYIYLVCYIWKVVIASFFLFRMLYCINIASGWIHPVTTFQKLCHFQKFSIQHAPWKTFAKRCLFLLKIGEKQQQYVFVELVLKTELMHFGSCFYFPKIFHNIWN